jgi:hypothetical protein
MDAHFASVFTKKDFLGSVPERTPATMKTYRGDLIKFKKKLENREPFAFSRYGDGELRILMGALKKHQEFKYDPEDPADLLPRERLLESFRYQSPNYHVGIACPECVGEEKFAWAKRNSGQDDDHLTWACLFVNSNYGYYREKVVKIFKEYGVVLVCQRSATPENLPFSVCRDFRVGINAWKDDYSIVEEIGSYIKREKVKGNLFLFCAGPFSCTLTHQLHTICDENTYLDIGSTLDPLLFGSAGLTRRYLRGAKSELEKMCIWR